MAYSSLAWKKAEPELETLRPEMLARLEASEDDGKEATRWLMERTREIVGRHETAWGKLRDLPGNAYYWVRYVVRGEFLQP